jgi:hypothetical protein
MRDRNRRLLRRRWDAESRWSCVADVVAECGSVFVTRCDVIAERDFVSDIGVERDAVANADAESVCVCV